MREKPRGNDRLNHMIEAIDNIFEFIDGKSFENYKSDKILRFAIIKNLEIVGESHICYPKILKQNML